MLMGLFRNFHTCVVGKTHASLTHSLWSNKEGNGVVRTNVPDREGLYIALYLAIISDMLLSIYSRHWICIFNGCLI